MAQKPFDDNGKLSFYPGSGAETFKVATNSTATIAALKTIIGTLIAIDHENYLSMKTSEIIMIVCYKRIPAISFTSFNGHTTIAPAKNWERVNNEGVNTIVSCFSMGHLWCW